MQSGGGASAGSSQQRTRKGILAAIFACAALAALAIPAWLMRDMMTVPQTTTLTGWKSVAAGAQVDIVVDVNPAEDRPECRNPL